MIVLAEQLIYSIGETVYSSWVVTQAGDSRLSGFRLDTIVWQMAVDRGKKTF